METSDHEAFVEAQSYADKLLGQMPEDLSAMELAYVLHLVEHGHLSTSAEEVVDELH